MSSWAAFEVIVATSHRVEKYGGVKLAESALQQIVDALNEGKLPLLGQHDWTKPIRTQSLEAQLVKLEDGELAVRLTGFADTDDWESAGPIGGMSFTTSELLGRAEGLHPENESLGVAADAGWWEDTVIGKACSIMSAVAPVDGKRLLQFSAFDDARVVLEIGYSALATFGPGLGSSAIWDGLKFLLAHRKHRDGLETTPTRVELTTDLNAGTVVGVIDTRDSDIARQALETYSKAVEAVDAARRRETTEKIVLVWTSADPDRGSWVPLDRGSDE